MKKSEKYFKLFDEKLKKYSTREVAKSFSAFDRFCFKHSGEDEPLSITVSNGDNIRKLYIQPWLFPQIIYFSTFYNDNKSTISEQEVLELYLAYYKYSTEIENEFADTNYADITKNIITPVIYGHMQEQTLYQISLYLFVNRFNRNYYLLKSTFFDTIDLSAIVLEKYGTDLDTFIHIMCAIAITSISYSILNDDILLSDYKFMKFITNRDLYLKIVDDMSISYNDSRTINNKEIFKISPILRTNSNEYIVPSIFTMFFNFGDKLYWLLKDKFYGKTTFINEFGNIFENYVFEILVKQYGESNVEKIPCVKGQKSADYIIKGKNYNFLIEVKSGVARANAKLENLDIQSLDFFIENNIVDAMKQLDASSKNYGDGKTNICIILNYDSIFVEDALLIDISSKYQPKNYDIRRLLLFGIDYFENFIFKYNDLEKLEKLFDDIPTEELKTYRLLENCEMTSDYFFKDIFKKETDKSKIN